MRPNFLLKIVLMLSLVLNFLLSSSFAAEDFNPINCARLVLPPIGRLSIDEEYALFEKRILIPEENITIESYPGSKDIFTVSNGTRLIPQKESLPCAKDWQQRLFHRYQLNIWKEDHREMVPLTVLLPAEFTQLHDRDRFMINLRAALGRAFTYEDLKKFIHESSAKKDFALRFQFLPGGLTKNLLHTYFEHTQVCPKRLDIKHTPDNSALDHHPESNAAEVLLPEEYKNGVTPSVAQFFHWINNLRALKMMYDDPVTKQNFFSHNKFRHRDEKIGLIFQDFSPAFMAARENILNDLSSRQIPPAPAPAKIVGQDPALPLRTYPEAFFNTHLNAQDEVQYSLDWINPAHPAIIASIPLNFEDLAPRNYEDGYWRNFVARLFGTILPLEARSKLGKVVIRVRPDLAEITTTVIPLAEAANKYAVTIEIPRTPQSSKRNIGITSLINSLGNLAYHNEAVFGMNLAKHFTETFAPVGSRTDFSMANVLAATGKITATDFDIYRFIDQDINPHAPPTLNIFGTVSYLAAVRDVTFLTKHASDRTKYKHNKWWLEFNLLGSNKVTKIGVDTLALPLQSSSQGPNFAHPQDQKVLQNFTTMMQEVLTPFLRVDLAPLLPSSIKFIAYNGPLPEIRDIHKFSKTIGTMCLYYDQDSYQYYNHKILIAWTFSKVDAPSITVILADDEKLPADPQSLAYQTLVQHLSSVIQQIIVDKIFVGPSRDEPPLSKDDLFSRIADHRRGKAIFSWVIRRIIFAGQDSADLDVEPAPALLDQQAALLYLETIRQITQSAPRADIDEMIEFVQAYLQDDFDHAPRLQGARDYVHHPKPYYITKELEVLKDQLQEFINERIYRLSTKNSKVDASKLSAITEDIKKIRAKILGEEDLKGDLQNFLQEFCQTPTFTELSPDAQEFIQAYLQNSYRINAHNNLLYNLFKKYNLYRSWQRLNFLPAAITIKDDQITFPVQWENNKALFKITLPWGDEPRDINQTIKEKLLPFAARLNNKKHNLSEILKDDIEIILRYPDSQELIKVDDAFLLANNSETIVLTDMKQGQGKYSLLAGVSPDKQRLYIIIPRNKSSEIKIGDYPIKGYWNFPGTDIILPKVVQDLLTRQDPVEQDALAK